MRKDQFYINLKEEDIQKNREEIIRLLHSTGREGIDTVIEHLDANNYFTYAASKACHDSFYGGLAYHSLMVYREAMRIYEAEKDATAKDVDPRSIIITTLLHDLCKLNRYPVLPGEKPQKIEYDREKGHGRISVVNIESIGFKLTYEEALAIRWHMSCYTKKADLMEGEKKKDGKRYATEYPLVAITIGGDSNAEDISAGRPAARNTIADVINLYDVKANRQLIDLTRLEDDSANNYSTDKAYKALIFDTDYFDDKSAEEVANLAEYVKAHDIKVGIVTTLLKAECTKWLKKSCITVGSIVGGGDIRTGMYSVIKKPNPRPMLLGLERLGCECNEVLSVCTKVIDKEASEGAGIDIIVNPTPTELIPLLSQHSKASMMLWRFILTERELSTR